MSDHERSVEQELVAAFDAGDRSAFGRVYDLHADRIYSYCLAMLRDPDMAEDATYRIFTEAAARLEGDEPPRLRPWLFALARDEIRHTPPGRAEAPPGGTDPGDPAAELREEVLDAVDGLSSRDREVLALHLTEGLEGDDLAEVMGVESSQLDDFVSRSRGRLEKSLGALLIARLGSDDCEEPGRLLEGWDGVFDSDTRASLNRHIGACETCRERRSLLTTPAQSLSGIMIVAAPVSLRDRVLEQVTAREGEALPVPPVRPGPNPRRADIAKIAVFAGVTLVVGLIGFAVSAQFEPLTQPVPPPSGGELLAEGPAPSSTTVPSTTSTLESIETNTSPPAPGVLEVSVDGIEFGSDSTSGQFEITNSGGAGLEFSVQPSAETLVLSAGGGQLGPGETVTFQVMLDRDAMAEGELAETISVSWDGGSVAIAVSGSKTDNPILHNPVANPSQVGVSPDCPNTLTTVSVRVRDSSPLASVVVRWSPNGGATQETSMADVGGDIFEAQIGPFTSVHSASVRMVAIDELGNAGGATISVEVVDCS